MRKTNTILMLSAAMLLNAAAQSAEAISWGTDAKRLFVWDVGAAFGPNSSAQITHNSYKTQNRKVRACGLLPLPSNAAAPGATTILAKVTGGTGFVAHPIANGVMPRCKLGVIEVATANGFYRSGDQIWYKATEGDIVTYANLDAPIGFAGKGNTCGIYPITGSFLKNSTTYRENILSLNTPGSGTLTFTAGANTATIGLSTGKQIVPRCKNGIMETTIGGQTVTTNTGGGTGTSGGGGGGATTPPGFTMPTINVYGVAGDNVIGGTPGPVQGTAAAENIYGWNAGNTGIGAGRTDDVYGGGGADLFVHSTSAGIGYQKLSGTNGLLKVRDFVRGTDKLQLKGSSSDYTLTPHYGAHTSVNLAADGTKIAVIYDNLWTDFNLTNDVVYVP